MMTMTAIARNLLFIQETIRLQRHTRA